MNPARSALLWASRNAWLRERLPRFGFAQKAVRRFMPGEDLDAALAAAEGFRQQGMPTIVTYLGENVTDAEEAAAVAEHYLDVLDRIAAAKLDCAVSIKLTQLGLDLGAEQAAGHLDALIERAATLGNMIWIDMEGSEYTDVTLDIYRGARERHENVGVCIQANLRRTAADLDALLPIRARIRLVKGAYAEPAEIAYTRKRDVDANFLALAERLLADQARAGADAAALHGFATHDSRMIEGVGRLARELGIDDRAVEFPMLYGIRAAEQRRLAAAGPPVRVLISYGEAWFPWYMRRLAERPANVFFVLRNLFPG